MIHRHAGGSLLFEECELSTLTMQSSSRSSWNDTTSVVLIYSHHKFKHLLLWSVLTGWPAVRGATASSLVSIASEN